MEYGQRDLGRGDRGEDVCELQVRLAGFRGTVPDGDFGPGTEQQVLAFQRDVMQMRRQTGTADRATRTAIDEFARAYPLDFDALSCPCGECSGFGQGRFKNRYRSGMARVEAHHRYEYPGIHRMLLWAVRALYHYLPEHRFVITSGYRCAVHNQQKGRTSTNHHGKAVDLDITLGAGEDKRDDMLRCHGIRGRLIELSNCQIGWAARNRKALEPDQIAPTWIHYDVRCYQRKYLADHFFCRSREELDFPQPSV